jgi:hypothetical protein
MVPTNCIPVLLIKPQFISSNNLTCLQYATNRKVAGSIPDEEIFKFT